MATIAKKEIVDRIVEKTGSTHITVKTVVQEFLDEIVSELSKNNRLEFRGFGIFETRSRAARMGQNPKTLEKVRLAAKRTVKFKAGLRMVEKLNGRRSH